MYNFLKSFPIMKKIILIAISALVLGLSANAQNYEFVPGWFIGVQGGAQYTAGETSFNNLISPTASLNVGYQFNPWFSLRGNINGWQGKGWFIVPDQGYKYNYGQLAVDAVFNLADFGKNFKPKAVNPYIFVGLGGMMGINNDQVKDLMAKYPEAVNAEKYWTAPTGSFLGRFGAGVDFRLSHRVLLGLEFADNMFSDKMNSKRGESKLLGIVDCDYNLSAQIGLKIALGETYKTRADKVAAADLAAAEAAALAAAEAARLAAEKEAAEKAAAEAAALAAAEKAAAEAAAAKAAAAAEFARDLCNENVFFELNKSYIRKSERAKIDAVIECLNAYPEAKVRISGHADKATGNSKINMPLSQRRAENVAKELVKAGIPQERIITEYFGDTANPFEKPEENRVSICVVNRSF